MGKLQGLSEEQIREKLLEKFNGIFFFPEGYESLRQLTFGPDKPHYELASLDEIVSIGNLPEIDDPGFTELLKYPLSCEDRMRLYCLSKGYDGIVNATRFTEPETRVSGVLKVSFQAIGPLALLNGHGQPYSGEVGIPIYGVHYVQGIKGLPVHNTKT